MSYFVRIKSRVFGPFDEPQLLEMKSKGKITRMTEVSENNKSDWKSAEAFPFLFESAPSAHSASQPSADDPAEWFYSTNGTEGYGPVTASAIEQMIQSGQLSNNSYVWQNGQNARLVKNEPRFSAPSGSSTSPTPAEHTENKSLVISGEPVYSAEIVRPLANSLGWMMFLKITLLILMILNGLCLICTDVFWISHAVGLDSIRDFLLILLFVAVNVGFYALSFKTLLCFWQYHTDLYQAVASGRESDLTKAHQCQFLMWKWLGITVIAWLALLLVAVITVAVIAGYGSGSLLSPFRSAL
jgi:hypothetical protein